MDRLVIPGRLNRGRQVTLQPLEANEKMQLAQSVLIGLKCLEQLARGGDANAAAWLREFREIMASPLLRL